MFNFSRRILISIGILIIVYSVLVIVLTKYSINKLLLDKQVMEDIPKVFAVANNTALLEEDFATVGKNLEALMNQLHSELGLAYVCIMDTARNPIAFFISPKFGVDTKSERFLREKFDKTDESIRVRADYSLFGVNIKELIITAGTPAHGIIRIGYFWDEVQGKAKIIQFVLIAVTIVALILMIIISLYLNNSFNNQVSEFVFTEKKIAIETARQHTLKEIETKQTEKLKRQLENEITQSEMFMAFEIFKDTLNSNDFMENVKIASNWLLKLFDAKQCSFYLVAENNQFMYCIYNIDGATILEGNAVSENTVIIGEGELGLAAQHKNYVLSDSPRTGYAINGPLIADNKLIGGVVVANKKDQVKRFDNHDKLLIRTVLPILSNILNKFLRGN